MSLTKMTTSETANGYQCTFSEKVPDDFYCKKCGLVARRVSVTSCCGESFCRACIEVEKGKPCPKCGSSSFTSMELVKQQARIQNLKVFCSMKKRGCDWCGSLQLLDSHLDTKLNNCRYVDIQCPLGCPKTLPRLKVEEHMITECQKRASVCTLCGFRGTFEEVSTKHARNCKLLPVQCPNICGIVIKRSELESHRKVCPREIVECSFSKLGCLEKCRRAEMEEHFKKNYIKHLELAAVAIKSLQEVPQKRTESQSEKELKKELQEVRMKLDQQNQQIEEQNMRLQKLEKSLSNHSQELEKTGNFSGIKRHRSKSEQKEGKKLMKIVTKGNTVKSEVPSVTTKSEIPSASVKLEVPSAPIKSEFPSVPIKSETPSTHVKSEDVCKPSKEEMKPNFLSNPLDRKPGDIDDENSVLLMTYVSEFTLENFSKEKAKDEPNKLETPPMYTHECGYKFSIGIDANGFGSSRGKAMRVWIRFLPGEYDNQLRWPARVTFQIELIGNGGVKNWIVLGTKTWLKPTSSEVSCQSFSYAPMAEYVFIDHHKLSGYLSNDAIRFKIAPAFVPQ